MCFRIIGRTTLTCFVCWLFKKTWCGSTWKCCSIFEALIYYVPLWIPFVSSSMVKPVATKTCGTKTSQLHSIKRRVGTSEEWELQPRDWNIDINWLRTPWLIRLEGPDWITGIGGICCRRPLISLLIKAQLICLLEMIRRFCESKLLFFYMFE